MGDEERQGQARAPRTPDRPTGRPSRPSDLEGPYAGLDLTGQVVVVVGAARGIGHASTLLLAVRGAHVLCLDRDAVGVNALVEELGHRGVEALGRALDVTRHDDIPGAIAVAIDKWGVIDAMVNCVGITGVTNRPSHEVPVADFCRVVETNLVSAFVLSQAVLGHMMARGYGRILHVASIAGKEGNAGMVSYSASKAGLIGMVKAQAKEYVGSGITINALAPGVIRTQLVEDMPPAQVEYMESRIPMGRCGTLAEVSEMIAWIISPCVSFTTGFTFDLSGGRATY
jgi:2-dehydro-3-deoxy-L-rhamnonate dehydrogenase (NAD+)